ncbi:MAG: hypothetical protein GTN78_17785, partial [Gemmatimonadales bacterium]|nr:hypothetical protein [Gemmatimonadales bacterium]
QIHMSDASGMGGDELEWSGTLRALEFKRSSEVWNAIDCSASHMYDFQGCFHDPDGFDETIRRWNEAVKGKPFISTELCINSDEFQSPDYRMAFTMGQLYHKNLVLLDAIALCYCWTLLNVTQPSFGWTRTLMVPDKQRGFVPTTTSSQLRVLGAFSRRIREGMVRVDASSTDPDLLVSAYV